jgi:hypothetical protein
MTSTDELTLEAIRNQIICTHPLSPGKRESGTDDTTDNLRILKPGMTDPTITTAYDRDMKSWRAAIWSDRHHVIFSTTLGTETMIPAMRKLLLLTSTIVNTKMDQWEAKSTSGSFHTSGGVMYL